MIHRDWLMRQIEQVAAFLGFLLFGKTSGTVCLEELPKTDGEDGELARRLERLVRADRICEAEDLLFEAVEARDPEALRAAPGFYASVNRFSDEALARCGFSRQEIADGLREVCETYGLPFGLLSGEERPSDGEDNTI